MTYEATLPPLGKSFWNNLLHGTETETKKFIQAMLQNEASNWGNVQDFIVLEIEGEQAAACAVFRPGLAPGSEAPFDLAHLEHVASSLAWSRETAMIFGSTFGTTWGEGHANLLKPKTVLIIENFQLLQIIVGRVLVQT